MLHVNFIVNFQRNLMKSQFPKTDGWWVGFTYIMPIGTSLGLVRQVENLTEMVERCSDWHNPCRDAEQKGCSFESHFAVSDNKCRPTSTRVGEIFEGFMTSFSRRSCPCRMAIRTTKMYKALSQKLAGANRFFPGELRKKGIAEDKCLVIKVIMYVFKLKEMNWI